MVKNNALKLNAFNVLAPPQTMWVHLTFHTAD